jgi:rare lipoprotein A (peptidoglycan hydrolase)
VQKVILIFLSTIIFISLSGCTSATSKPDSFAAMTVNIKGKNSVCYPVKQSSSFIFQRKKYEEQGVASWYGRNFHKKRTSSGERYNMYQLTAAHKTLPLSSYVLVTNLKNGRQVVVKVNDRGPFVYNRLIDLSYAAAKKLNMVGRGTAPVSIKPVVCV